MALDRRVARRWGAPLMDNGRSQRGRSFRPLPTEIPATLDSDIVLHTQQQQQQSRWRAGPRGRDRRAANRSGSVVYRRGDARSCLGRWRPDANGDDQCRTCTAPAPGSLPRRMIGPRVIAQAKPTHRGAGGRASSLRCQPVRYGLIVKGLVSPPGAPRSDRHRQRHGCPRRRQVGDRRGPDAARCARPREYHAGRVTTAPAAASCPTSSSSAPGSIAGTPAYFSPELAGGEYADERSDIDGPGTVLYQALTGEPPFRGGELTGLLAAILFDPIRPAADVRGEAIPPEIEAIALRCLARELADRFATAQDLAAALEAWSQEHPLRPARPDPGPGEAAGVAGR
jgi:hypothetical protein